MKKGTKIIKKPIDVFNSFYFTHNAVALWKEYCVDNDVEFNEDSIDWDYICDMRDFEWEDVMYNLIDQFAENEVILSGFLGLWNGRPQIANYHFAQIEKAIHKCLSSGDEWQITYDNWGIYIDVFHHDGTNSFTISPIKQNTNLSAEMIERFNPKKHKRLIRRIDTLWE
jgi:hypothetical protein